MELDNIILQDKKPKGRPRKYDFVAVDNGSNNEIIERKIKEKATSQYYQDHKEIKVICPHCSKLVQKYSIGKHQRSKYCQDIKLIKQKLI